MRLLWLLAFRTFGLALAGVALSPLKAVADAPPPPGAAEEHGQMRLHLALVINDRDTGWIVPVTASGGEFWINASVLREAGLPLDPVVDGVVNLQDIAGLRVRYDEPEQRLLLNAPPAWLPPQTLRGRGAERVEALTSAGALFNYDFYVAERDGGGSHAALWNEARVFGPLGVIRATGVQRQTLSGARRDGGYTRLDTGWTYVDDERIRIYEAGDFITRGLGWSDPVRMGGAQISRDFSVRPDVITYPLPNFSGVASVPSAVDLFINGHRAASDTVQPGPFTLEQAPYVNGAGEATVVTTDAQGRRVTAAIPFYVASTLLRPGLSDYALSVGGLRRDYGRNGFSYGPLAASGALRAGVTSGFTAEAMAQAGGSLALAGAGGLLRIGRLGVIDGSAALSRNDGDDGSQLTLGYQYTNRRFNFMIRHVRRSAGFAELSTMEFGAGRLSRREIQGTASIALDGLGTIGASYVEARRRDERVRLFNASYQRSLGRSSLLVSANHDLERESATAMLHLVMPIGSRGAASAGLERTRGRSFAQRLTYSRAAPADGGLGWNLAARRMEDSQLDYQADLTWRTRPAQLQAGAYGSRAGHIRWASASGSAVFMDGAVFAANRVNDAFALVSTDGVGGVPVLYENQKVGETDARGHLLIPWAAAYHPAKYEIDPLNLPADIVTPVVEQRAAVSAGGGRVVRFPLRRVAAAAIVLVDQAGRPLPLGAQVSSEAGQTAQVGWDGVAYLEGLEPTNRLMVALPDGGACAANFAFEGISPAPIGPVICQ